MIRERVGERKFKHTQNMFMSGVVVDCAEPNFFLHPPPPPPTSPPLSVWEEILSNMTFLFLLPLHQGHHGQGGGGGHGPAPGRGGWGSRSPRLDSITAKIMNATTFFIFIAERNLFFRVNQFRFEFPVHVYQLFYEFSLSFTSFFSSFALN